MPADAAPAFVWVPEVAPPGAMQTLATDDAHYVARVCRAREGDRVTLTDGRGGLARARVVSSGKSVKLEIESFDPGAPLPGGAWVLCGAPEGTRADWLVEKLAELGVAVLQPVDTARATWEARGGRLERWERLATAALRQSQRRHRLEVRAPRPLAEVLDDLPPGSEPAPASAGLSAPASAGVSGGGGRYVADPDGAPAAGIAAPSTGWTVGAVGPAPGFSPEESAALAGAGFRAMALSDGRLRTETAALAWASWWASGRVRPPSSPSGPTADPERS